MGGCNACSTQPPYHSDAFSHVCIFVWDPCGVVVPRMDIEHPDWRVGCVVQALDRWEERLEAVFEGRPYDSLDAALTDTISKFPVDIQPFRSAFSHI